MHDRVAWPLTSQLKASRLYYDQLLRALKGAHCRRRSAPVKLNVAVHAPICEWHTSQELWAAFSQRPQDERSEPSLLLFPVQFPRL